MRLSIISIVAFAATNVNAFTMTSAGIAQRTALSMTAENNEVKEIKVGVIGCGRIGIVHLGAITKAPNVKPIIVSNPTVSKAEAG
jgi:phosphoglycerate dehydrogenase-like enzyme